MKTPTTEMIGGTYLVCNICREGNLGLDGPFADQFKEHHMLHGSLEIVLGSIFLSTFIEDGYIDAVNPDLEPLKLKAAQPGERTGLQPGGAEGAKALHRSMLADRAPKEG